MKTCTLIATAAMAISAVASGQAPTPAPMQEVDYSTLPRYRNPHAYTVDVHAAYGFSAAPSSKYETDMFGCEVEGAFYFTPRQAVTLSLGVAGGGDDHHYWVSDGSHYWPFTDSYDRTDITLMAGYRFTQPLGRYVTLSLGAKCGLDVQYLSVDYGYGFRDWWDDGDQDGTSAGFGYAGYAGFGFQLSPHVSLEVAYQYRGATTKPRAKSGYVDVPDYKASSMRWHEVRVGFRCRF